MTFILATLGVIISGLAAIYSASRNSIFIFFWAASFYLYFFPVFADVLSISVIGSSSYFENLITSRYLGDANNLESAPYFDMSVIGISFSLSFFLIQLLGSKNIKMSPDRYLFRFSKGELFVFAWLTLLALLIFVVFNNKSWFAPSLFVPQSSIAYIASFLIVVMSGLLIPALHQKRFILSAIFFTCPIIVSLGTSQRPWAIAAFGTLLFYFMVKQKNIIDLVKLASISIFVGSFSIAALLAIRHGLDKSLLNMVFSRDTSFFSALYVFSKEELFEGVTGGGALFFLLQAGWVPDALRIGSYSDVNIPLFVAEQQRGWTRGSMHPTVFAWAYVDLGYLAFIAGAVLALGVSLVERVVLRIETKGITFLVPVAAFAFTAIVRGTVQRGWSNFVLMASLVVMIAIILNLRRKRHALPDFPNR